MSHGVAANLGNSARQLDPGWAAADDDEGEPRGARRGVWLALRGFEREQDAAAHLQRVFECLETRRHALPLWVSEVGMTRARRQNQVVIT